MKKIILSLVIVIISVINVNAQMNSMTYDKSNIFSKNNAIMIGMNVGGGETNTLFDHNKPGACSNVLLGVNSKIYGVVFNAGFYLNHSSSTSIDYFSGEDNGFFLHFGYNFQLLRWFSVAPLIGYSKHEIGDYDGSNWRVTSSGISNKFYSDASFSGFDYGAQISFDIPCGNGLYFNIPIAMTKHVIYAGIGMTVNMGEMYKW